MHMSTLQGHRTGDGIPSFSRLESRASTIVIRPILDIIEDLRMRVEYRIQEAHWTFSGCCALFINQCDDRSEDGSRETGAIRHIELLAEIVKEVCTIGRDVWKASTCSV